MFWADGSCVLSESWRSNSDVQIFVEVVVCEGELCALILFFSNMELLVSRRNVLTVIEVQNWITRSHSEESNVVVV